MGEGVYGGGREVTSSCCGGSAGAEKGDAERREGIVQQRWGGVMFGTGEGIVQQGNEGFVLPSHGRVERGMGVERSRFHL